MTNQTKSYNKTQIVIYKEKGVFPQDHEGLEEALTKDLSDESQVKELNTQNQMLNQIN
ncbi:MAG: hypothetical protein ACPLXC_00205 [Candidatus Pacearchaeota archaeon]